MSDRRFRVLLRCRLSLALVVAVASACVDAPSETVELAATGVTRHALEPPVNSLPSAQTTNEDTRLTFVFSENGISLSDVDNTQTQVQLTVTNGTFTALARGGVTITGNGTPDVILAGPIGDAISGVIGSLNGSYFQPAVNFSGAAQLQMNSQDTDGDSDLDILPITVTPFNDPPVVTLPAGVQTATEDTPKAVSLTVSDVDIDGADIAISLTSTNGTLMTLPVSTGLTFQSGGPTAASSMTFTGALTDVNSALNGLTITPAANYVGTSTVNITANDQGASGNGDPGVDNETLTLSWQAVNDPPVNTVPAQQTIDEDASLTFSSGGGTALSVSDADAPTTLLQVTLSATNGRVSLGSTSGVSFVNGDGVDDTSFAFTGTLAQITTALQGTVFAPNANFAGTARVTLTTNDLGNSGAGGAKQDTDFIDVVVNAINDAPVNTVPSAQLANEDVALTFGDVIRVSVADADATSLTTTLAVSGGKATLSRTTGLVFQSGDGTADATMTFTGTIANVNAALLNMRFLSNANYYGPASITLTTSDLGLSGSGGILTDEDSVAITVIAVNDAPAAENDNYTVDEDSGATTLAVLGNDTFAPDVGETLSLVSVSTASSGTVVVDGDTVQYTPAAHFFGVATFSYVVSDGELTDTATVTVTVAATDDPPVANDDDYTVAQEQEATLGLLSNDSIAPDVGENLTITAVTQPANGSVVIDAAKTTVRYTGNTGYVGSDSFSYTISDGSLTATANVDLTVVAVLTVPVNSLPAPQATTEDLPLVFSNGNGNPITVADNNETLNVDIVVTNGKFRMPTTAGLTVIGNDSSSVSMSGTIANINTALNAATYTPNASFNGAALLTITSQDTNGNSDQDSLTLTVTAANDGPVNTVPGTQAATEDTPKAFSNISVADVDVGAGQVQVTLAASNGTVVTLATTTALMLVTGDGVSDADVSFRGLLADVNAALNGMTVVPPKNFIGSSTLTIVTNDLGNVGSGGAKEDSDTVTINWAAANDAPVNQVPPAQETEEDVPLELSQDLLNPIRVSDDDAGGASLRVTLAVTNGTLSLGSTDGLSFTQGDGVDDVTMTFDGSLAALNGAAGDVGALDGIVFAPTAGFAGTATLTMTTNDLGNSGGAARTDTDSLSITVVAVNDAPVNTVPGEQITSEDTQLTFSSAAGNGIAVADSDATQLQISISVTNGVLSLSTIAALVFQAGDGTDDATMTFRGSTSAVNTSLSGLRFVPAADFSGAALLSLHSDDLGGTGLGGPLTDDDSVEIIVAAINDPPTASDDSYSVDEDALPTALAVLVNDSILPDSDETLTVVALTTPNRGGTVTTDGTTVTYQPLANFFGTERFDYTLSDGSATATARVTISINAVDDPPNAVADAITVPRNAINYLLPVLDNDDDPDAVWLRITAATTPAHGTLTIANDGTELRFTATPAYSGPDSFDYTIEDAEGLSATGTVTLTIQSAVNSTPIANDDVATLTEDSAGRTIDVLVNDEGLTDAPISVTVAAPPTFGTATVQEDGTIVYVPNADYFGTDSFQYSVTDGDGESDTAAVSLTISAFDDVPVASVDVATTDEDTAVNIAVLANDRGLGDGGIVVTIMNPSVFGTAVVEEDNTLTFTPAADYNGRTIVVYAISDGEQSANAAVTIVVNPVADAPLAVSDAAYTRLNELVVVDVLANDSDADGDTLTVTAVSTASNGTASLVDGKVQYAPAAEFQGTEELEYTIDDGTGLTGTGALLIAVGLDSDGDGLIDLDELDLGTDPAEPDSDGDSISDGLEVAVVGTDPLDDDSDDDGLLDGNEDLDRDGVVDEGETDANDFDTDDDHLSDGVEQGLTEPQGDDTDETVFVADADPTTTTDPRAADSDGDGLSDGLEDTNLNGLRDAGERDPTVADAPIEEPPDDDGSSCGGCNAMGADGAIVWFALLVLLRRSTRRRRSA